MGAIGYFSLVIYTVDPGLGKFLGALIFPTGIIAVLLLGSELFTSNCMGILSVYKKSMHIVANIFYFMMAFINGASVTISGVLTSFVVVHLRM